MSEAYDKLARKLMRAVDDAMEGGATIPEALYALCASLAFIAGYIEEDSRARFESDLYKMIPRIMRQAAKAADEADCESKKILQ